MRGSRGAARHFRTRSALAAPARSPTDDCRIPNRLDPNEDVGTSRRSMEGKQSMEQSPVEADPATAATSPRTGGCRYGCPIPDGGQGRSEVSRSPSAFNPSRRRNTVPFGNVPDTSTEKIRSRVRRQGQRGRIVAGLLAATLTLEVTSGVGTKNVRTVGSTTARRRAATLRLKAEGASVPRPGTRTGGSGS